MKLSISKLIGFAIALAVLSGCAPKPAEQLIGKWEKTSGRESQTFEFKKDGSFSMVAAVVFGVNGNYKFIESNVVQLSTPNGTVILTAMVTVSDDVLTLSPTDKSSPATYRRIVDASVASEKANSQQANQTLADALKEQQAKTPMPELTLPKLSAAAEKAVQEGFVEITDPKVRACTDAKIAVIQKEIGDNNPISFEVFNEAAVKCGFNI